MNVILPARGEFGLKVRYHVPAVHAMGGPKIVYCEEGCEALYPSAATLLRVPRAQDDLRRGTHPRGDRTFMDELRKAAAKRWPAANVIQTRPGRDPEARFLPQPFVPQVVPAVDVVVCPRKREYGASKNWEHWVGLVNALKGAGLTVFAGGAPDSSYDVPCTVAWDYDRFLDATIRAMNRARLVISTDAGLAHLAVLCGRPLLLITHEGRVAPGPVVDDDGKVMEAAYWASRVEEYYHAANHAHAPIIVSRDWMRPASVLSQALGFLRMGEAA